MDEESWVRLAMGGTGPGTDDEGGGRLGGEKFVEDIRARLRTPERNMRGEGGVSGWYRWRSGGV